MGKVPGSLHDLVDALVDLLDRINQFAQQTVRYRVAEAVGTFRTLL